MKCFTEFYDITKLYLASLQFRHNKTLSKYERDQKKYKILVYTFGLEGRTYNRNEIAILLDLTIERVRQVLKEALNDIKKNVYNPDSLGLFGKNLDAIYKYKKDLEEEQVLSYNALLNSFTETEKVFNNFRSFLDLFYEILDFKLVKIHLHYLKDNDVLITSKKINKTNFIQTCYTVYIIVEKNVIPIEENDLIINVRKKIATTKDEILLACKVINSITIIENTYQIAFEKLSTSSDMAYRILFEKKEQLKAVEILREINFRLLPFGKKRVDKLSLNSQMNSDSRLIPLGKSGFWTLKEWNESKKTLFDLINEVLISSNSPLTKKEIFDSIIIQRPNTPKRSLNSFLYDKRYLQIKGDKFILREWKDIYKHDIVITKRRNTIVKENPVALQIKEQVINLFLENNSTEILLSTIVKSLNNKFNFPKASIYKVINEDSDFITSAIDDIAQKKIVRYKAIKTISQANQLKSTSLFVSYSWESEKHINKVISFVEFLRKNGFEADMDIKLMQEETAIDLNRLMHMGILKYDKVIVILSRSYKTKAETFQGGVGKEYKFITGNIEKNPNKYILVSFETITNNLIDEIVPIDFIGREIVDLVKDELNDFQTLFSKLTNTGIYKFSEVASNTPLIETKKISPFTLKNKQT